MKNPKNDLKQSHPREVRLLENGEIVPFLMLNHISIIYVEVGATEQSVSSVIRGRFLQWREPPISVAAVSAEKLDIASFIRPYVGKQLESLGLEFNFLGRPPSGYYLFFKTKLFAYHKSFDLESDGLFFAAAGVAGVFFTALTDSPAFAQLGAEVAALPSAVRAANFFEQCILKFCSSKIGQQQSPPAPPPDAAQLKLLAAYERLGLSESATDDEVAVVYKKLVKENHPDRCRGDAAAVAFATQRTTEINIARDVILGRPRK